MRRRTTRSYRMVEDIVVPDFDVVGEIVEGVGRAGAELLPHEPIDAGPAHRPPSGTDPDTAGRQQRERQERERRAVPYWYPPVEGDPPWGVDPDSPMDEGPEETAVPLIDPADLRLGQIPEPDRKPDRGDAAGPA